MRISDWSSDVCSSDLVFYRNVWAHNVERNPLIKGGGQALMINNLIYNPGHRAVHYNLMNLEWVGHDYVTGQITAIGNVMRGGNDTDEGLPFLMRSEEHTSELQSLMRISYAVFCLKKKKHTR